MVDVGGGMRDAGDGIARAQDVVRLDPALDTVVSSDAKVELVKGGFGFTEGPVWIQKGRQGHLLFTNIPGNVYVTGPGGVWIISPECKHLGTIHAPEQSTSMGFGDAERKTLYIAARTSIYKIRVNTPGI